MLLSLLPAAKVIQEKLTNCGTMAGDVFAVFLAGKLQSESTEDFGAFGTTVTSQRLPIQNVAPSATVWLQLKEGVLRSLILGVRVGLAGWDSHQSKAHPRLVLLYLPPFGRNSNVMIPLFDLTFGG